jgi:methionyl-tRNA formyltransferase
MDGMNPRVVFMGSPDFALPTLEALAKHFQVVGVVTQPDRPAGRGRQLTPPPVKEAAEKLDLPVIQPNRLSEPQALAQLQEWAPHVIVVAAFGQILRPAVLELPEHGCVNVHASLLPRWRGAAPIQAAILHGDEQTGVTIMKMDPGLDTGPVLSQRATPIGPRETAGSLFDRLASLGAELLIETLPAYLSGQLVPQPQDDSQATLAPRLQKSAGELDFQQPAEALARQVRAFNPWPGAYTAWDGQRLKIHQAHAAASEAAPGEKTMHAALPAIGTTHGLLVLEVVQPAGKQPQSGEEFLRGARGWLSDHKDSA